MPPSQLSVGDTFVIEPQSEQYARPVLNAIDAVHKVSRIQEYRLTFEAPKEGSGEFDPEHRLIRIDPAANRWDLALVHEVGHWIDYEAMFVPEQYASRKSKMLADWRAAVKKTDAVRRMNHLLKVNEYSVNTPEGKKVTVRVNRRYLEYCLDWAELWACSYTQFVATHTSFSSTLGFQVEQETLETVAQMYPRYWMKSDFLPVSAEINTIFRNLRWMK